VTVPPEVSDDGLALLTILKPDTVPDALAQLVAGEQLDPGVGGAFPPVGSSDA
jgi:hypothetical protein